jgi:flagellum-specific peptidoglycan hydrolase FlgJ
MGLTINKNLMYRNHTAMKRSNSAIQWIVVHYVGALGDAKANTDYYKSTNVGASADFWVGHGGDIWQGNDYRNYYSWHCGGGRQSSGGGKYFGICKNANSVGVEMCVKKKSTRTMNATDRDWYFAYATITSAARLVAQLMHELDIDIEHVIRHYDVNGKYCPNPFVFDTGDVKWADFKKLVEQYYKGEDPKAAADPKPTATTTAPADQGVKPSGIPASQVQFISDVGKICQSMMSETGILASVVTAQCCLETGFGFGTDSTELVRVNNILGMKADLINGTWKQYTVWDGATIVKRTPEYYNGKLNYIIDTFRAYPNYEQCIRDYEMFLLHVQNSKGLKYARIKGMTDPAAVIHAIRIGTGTSSKPEGYCTDPNYETKILNLIKRYNLTQYDSYNGELLDTGDEDETETPSLDGLFKDGDPDEVTFVDGKPVSVNAAKSAAPQNASTAPQIAPQTVVEACLQMNEEMIKSQSNGAKWAYYNSKTSQTFAKALEQKNYRVNCATTANWALKMIGVMRYDLAGFYGEKNGVIKWKSAATKTAVTSACDVISVGGKKTVVTAIADGTLKAGDIVTYYDIRHTNIYLGGGRWLDSGHAYAKGTGDGATFGTWIGSTVYGAQRIGCIIRLKAKPVSAATKPAESKPTATVTRYYRVQAGAYRLKDNANQMVHKLSSVGYKSFIEQNMDGMYIVICGSFTARANADKRVAELKAKGISSFVQ